ncbi:TPA: hypothetical protein HA244_03695 [Candidatus Micrarchaeota archaeon]|nr:hypothetical protein [Candidatus Micrarchaeota archaeon]
MNQTFMLVSIFVFLSLVLGLFAGFLYFGGYFNVPGGIPFFHQNLFTEKSSSATTNRNLSSALGVLPTLNPSPSPSPSPSPQP